MPHRILVVDDEEDELAAWILPYGKPVICSYSVHATRALELCDEFVFDLVMLD